MKKNINERPSNKEITETIEVNKNDGGSLYYGVERTADKNVDFDKGDGNQRANNKFASSVPFASLGRPCTKPPKRG